MINKYPYTDFHELNLDWFLEEFKKTVDKVTDLDTTVQQFTDFVTNYFDNLDVQQEINKKLDEMAASGELLAALEPFVQNLNNRVAAQDEEIAVLVGRMDEFASLPPGSTSGNAELLDIRVQANGVTAASAGDAVRAQVTDCKDLISTVSDVGWEDDSVTATDAIYVNKNTGEIATTSGSYAACVRTKIPEKCTRIILHNVNYNPTGIVGWATYSTDQGSSISAFVRGGQTHYIDVQPSDLYFAISTQHDGTPPASFDITYVYGSVNGLTRAILMDLDEPVVDSMPLNDHYYVNANTGAFTTIPSAQYCATQGRINIPVGCTHIFFPWFNPKYAGIAGWAVYTSAVGSATGTYIRGALSNLITVQPGDVAFGFSSYYYESAAPADAPVVYFFGQEQFDKFMARHLPMYNKIIAFVGDSVTYGYDDANAGQQLANPFPAQVSYNTGATVINEGISSASLMDGVTADGHTPTPCAWVLQYPNLDNRYDIVGTMIGINDSYRNYVLGTFTDRVDTTFYGALHIYCAGMLAKYAPKDGKKLFFMLYPQYDAGGNATNYNRFLLFRQAMKEVAEYYSIPILDLAHELGMSVFADTSFEYWPASGNGHSPHPSQLGADLIGTVVSNWIEKTFA